MDNKVLQRCADDIAGIGWHWVYVPADDEGPAFGYSVGFFASFATPEIIVTGLSQELTHAILRSVYGLLVSGWAPKAGNLCGDLLHDYRCSFQSLSDVARLEWFGVANAFYGESSFPSLQCFWPDKRGRFPYSPDTLGFSDVQPIIAELPL